MVIILKQSLGVNIKRTPPFPPQSRFPSLLFPPSLPLPSPLPPSVKTKVQENKAFARSTISPCTLLTPWVCRPLPANVLCTCCMCRRIDGGCSRSSGNRGAQIDLGAHGFIIYVHEGDFTFVNMLTFVSWRIFKRSRRRF